MVDRDTTQANRVISSMTYAKDKQDVCSAMEYRFNHMEYPMEMKFDNKTNFMHYEPTPEDKPKATKKAKNTAG